MILKYITGGSGDLIQIQAVERETESSVWVDAYGRRDPKWGKYIKYHATWEAARNYLMEEQTTKIMIYQSRLDSSKAKKGKISRLKKGDCK